MNSDITLLLDYPVPDHRILVNLETYYLLCNHPKMIVSTARWSDTGCTDAGRRLSAASCCDQFLHIASTSAKVVTIQAVSAWRLFSITDDTSECRNCLPRQTQALHVGSCSRMSISAASLCHLSYSWSWHCTDTSGVDPCCTHGQLQSNLYGELVCYKADNSLVCLTTQVQCNPFCPCITCEV